jgi:hypothetical protein
VFVFVFVFVFFFVFVFVFVFIFFLSCVVLVMSWLVLLHLFICNNVAASSMEQDNGWTVTKYTKTVLD